MSSPCPSHCIKSSALNCELKPADQSKRRTPSVVHSHMLMHAGATPLPSAREIFSKSPSPSTVVRGPRTPPGFPLPSRHAKHQSRMLCTKSMKQVPPSLLSTPTWSAVVHHHVGLLPPKTSRCGGIECSHLVDGGGSRSGMTHDANTLSPNRGRPCRGMGSSC